MTTIEKKPSLYNLAGNLPDLVLGGVTEAVSFSLSHEGQGLVTETYYPDPEGRVTIKLRNILENMVPCPDFRTESAPIPRYTYRVEDETGEFYCLKGGLAVDIPLDGWLKSNFLTWQPQTRYTLYHTPHALRYAALTAGRCKLRAYFKEGRTTETTLAELQAGTVHTFDTSFGRVRGLLSEQPTYYDVWVEDAQGTVLTWTQRYVLRDELSGTNDFFVWENSLGGFDTVLFTGDRKEVAELESAAAVLGDDTLEYDIDRNISWTKYTGYIPDEATRLWILDFFNSSNRYHLADGVLRRIVVSKPKLEATAGEAAGYEFTFAYSRQSRYLNLPRVPVPENLEIVDPADELFFLAPRLAGFPLAEITDEAIIPVQYAYADKWYHLPLKSLLAGIRPGIDEAELSAYLAAHAYATESWVTGQIGSLHTHSHLSVLEGITSEKVALWDAGGTGAHTHPNRDALDRLTLDENGNVRLSGNLLVSGGIVALADGSVSGEGGGSGVDLPLNVTDPAVGDFLRYDGTHWKNVALTSFAPASHTHPWGDITGKPSLFPPLSHTHGWADLTGKPDSFPPSGHMHDWGDITGKPTTLSGYGITDALTASATVARSRLLDVNNDAGGLAVSSLQFMQLSNQNTAGDLPTSEWYHVLKANHGNGDTYYNRTLAFHFFSDEIYTRRREGGVAHPWARLWHSGNSNLSTADWAARNLSVSGLAYISCGNQWGGVLQLGRPGSDLMTAPGTAIVGSTDGGLHLDGGEGKPVYLQYYQGGAGTALYVGPDGNTGIGTVAPSCKLDVQGKIYSSDRVHAGASDSYPNRPGAFMSPAMAVNDGTILSLGKAFSANNSAELSFVYAGEGSTSNYLGLGFFSTGILLAVRADGNVGIGTTVPRYKLDVMGDMIADGWLRTTGERGWFNNTYGGGWYMTDTAWIRAYGDKKVYVSNNEAFSIFTAGGIRADGGLIVTGPVTLSYGSCKVEISAGEVTVTAPTVRVVGNALVTGGVTAYA